MKGALYTGFPITRIAAPLLCQPRSGAQFTKRSDIVHSTTGGCRLIATYARVSDFVMRQFETPNTLSPATRRKGSVLVDDPPQLRSGFPRVNPAARSVASLPKRVRGTLSARAAAASSSPCTLSTDGGCVPLSPEPPCLGARSLLHSVLPYACTPFCSFGFLSVPEQWDNGQFGLT